MEDEKVTNKQLLYELEKISSLKEDLKKEVKYRHDADNAITKRLNTQEYAMKESFKTTNEKLDKLLTEGAVSKAVSENKFKDIEKALAKNDSSRADIFKKFDNIFQELKKDKESTEKEIKKNYASKWVEKYFISLTVLTIGTFLALIVKSVFK